MKTVRPPKSNLMDEQKKLFLHQSRHTALRTCKTAIAVCCLLFLSLASTALAKPITSEQAKTAAQVWRVKEVAPLKASLGGSVSTVASFKDASGSDLYHVVYLKPAGFVILPADDRIEPIIAFSPEGQYVDSDDTPLGALVRKDLPGRMAHVRKLDSIKDAATTASPTQKDATQKKWDTLLTPSTNLEYGLSSISDVRVAPLVQSKWSQSTVSGSNCYNYYTPNNYVTGCVATALSQLMRFHQRPSTSVGTGSYTITVDNVDRSEPLMGGNGSGGPYDWASMTLVPASGVTTAQCQAIGRLMHDAGAAVNMDYTASSSGTDTLLSATALKSTFGYSNAIKGYNSGNNLPTDARNTMVNPNLDAGLPVLFGITGTSGGHAIVGDGYGYQSGTMYHHLNMGWSGSNDLWYNLPTIDDSYFGFTSVYKVVYNVYTTGTGEIISGRATDCSGMPISGATVTATRSGYSPLTTTTNSNGVYFFKNVASGATFTITITKSGVTFSPASQSVTVGTSTDQAASTGNKWGIDVSAICTPVTLSVQTNGSGTVTSSPGGIICGSGGAACSAVFNKNSSVTLTAVATTGSLFTGWSGGGCSGTGACVVTLADDTTVTAAFSTVTPLMNENFDGAGTPALPTGWSTTSTTPTAAWATHAGTNAPSGIAAHSGANLVYFNSWSISSDFSALLTSPVISLADTFNNTASFWMYRDTGYAATADRVEVYVNTTTNLTGATLLGTINRSTVLSPAVADSGWYQYSFSIPESYNGATNHLLIKGISANGNDIHIDDISVAGVSTYTLTVIPASTAAGVIHGGGSISGSDGISCSSVNGGTKTGTCSGSFNSGSTVTLAAAADVNSTFTAFSGPSGCTTAGGCSFSINADTTITGSFAGAYKAKILNLTGGDDTLTAAHTRAGSGATILARQLHNATTLAEEPFIENLTITKAITLKGGYNAGFNSNAGLYSTLSGILTIGGGSLTVENLIVK